MLCKLGVMPSPNSDCAAVFHHKVGSGDEIGQTFAEKFFFAAKMLNKIRLSNK